MKLQVLKTDARTLEDIAWTVWLQEAARMVARFNSELDHDDPFSYNETASVSLLTAAAAKAGYLALAEFTTTKKAAHDRRSRSQGRSDFWMDSEARSWAFEFKQITNGPITLGRLRTRFAAAVQCASCILKVDADVAVAGLIVPVFFVDDDKLPAVRSRLTSFVEECQYAWLISGRTDGDERDPEVYFFFKTMKPKSRPSS